ncbi:MAG: membrane-associated zinc metalloprotease, regulator of sigma E protease [Candidatus Peregrinibacteria bacterium GW2011_GWC2_39_14]|nr:MAG: membrane-associated zinc metalloprotease, regulator of sigma E protease [Candidatus Peregrinibacteria bacterium GW2011_GWC2_39_14]
MNILLTVIVFIVIFSLIVLIHEFGHFFVAKREGVKVEEFGFGLPPRAYGIKRGDTIYSLNWLPFGGFIRMFGEDSKDAKMITHPDSFMSKSIGARSRIIVAGVLMNFLLSIVLLSVGFSIGIKPLMVSEEDILANISNGTIETANGVLIKEVASKSHAEDLGLKAGDAVIQIDGKDITDFDALKKSVAVISDKWPVLKVRRGDSVMNIELRGKTGVESGITFYDAFFLPRVIVKDVKKDSEISRAGLRDKDIILSMNSEQIYDMGRAQSVINENSLIKFVVSRDYKSFEFTANLPLQKTVIASDVLADGSAFKAGFLKNDYILQVNKQNVFTPKQVIEEVTKYKNVQTSFVVDREGKRLTLYAVPNAEGQIGLMLSSVFSPDSIQFGSYLTSVPTSLIKINDVSYPVHEAVWKSITESKRLAVFTVGMFGRLVEDIFGTLEVPQGVSGPVGIAHMTYVFVKEGFSSVLRFTALLSLSLAVINILPFPGLDGGRLLFVLIEGVTGKRVNQKVESWIHLIGFFALLFLIVMVTYKDILSLI